MKLSLTRVLLTAACATLTLSLAIPSAHAASVDRGSDAGQVLLWLLGVKAREQEAPRKVDVNSATVHELVALPGIERHQAQAITVKRPYAKLQDLARAGLSSRLIERLAPWLTVGDTPSASPGPAKDTTPRQ
jgi:DNA uptake protein ComE-like DNA-binding protein